MTEIDSKYFFQYVIKDNQTNVYVNNRINDFSSDFYVDTSGKRSKENHRKEAIFQYLKDVRSELGKIELSDYSISYLVDKEFDFNQDNFILNIQGESFEDIRITSSNIVGSIHLKGNQLNINSRFGNHFLAYMIASTSGFIELENFGDISEEKGIGEWILLLYWKNKLKHAFSQGIYKTYHKKRENLSTVRGNIDINQLIKKQYFDGKTMCEFKEHSYDNNLNKVIYHAIQKVSKSNYSELLFDIYPIKRAFESIPFNSLSYNFSENTVGNPYYKNYNEVFELSKRILQNNFINVSSKDSQFSAFLFDISLLFEHHIRKVLKTRFELKPKDLFEFKVPNGMGENKLFPDIIIDYGNNEIGVFDVKYKHYVQYGASPGVVREDRFQLISYVAYYLNIYKVVRCGIIYPCNDEEYEEKICRIHNYQTVNVAKNKIPFNVFFYRVKEQDFVNQQFEVDKTFTSLFEKPYL
jgi:5-methylcytosine-specific restriction endonuclease McrBC regulatory subunit McrC